jgi:hypothetical protein
MTSMMSALRYKAINRCIQSAGTLDRLAVFVATSYQCCATTNQSFYEIQCKSIQRTPEIRLRLFSSSSSSSSQEGSPPSGESIKPAVTTIDDLKNSLSSELIKELKSYGLDTKRLLERVDLLEAVVQARAAGMIPVHTCTRSMKEELSSYGANVNQILDKSVLTTMFMQSSVAIRDNVEALTMRQEASNDLLTTEKDKSTNETSSDPIKESANPFAVEKRLRILDEMGKLEHILDVDLQRDLSQTWGVSHYNLLKHALAVVRIDGIVDRQRLHPSVVWKSIRFEDLILGAYISSEDRKMAILKPSTEVGSDSDQSARDERIQTEIANVRKLHLSKVIPELETTWGISSRCLYIGALAVLRVYGLIGKSEEELQDLVKEVPTNDEMETLCDKALQDPVLRAKVEDYMRNPETYHQYRKDPDFANLIDRPAWRNNVMEAIQKSNQKKRT